MSGFILQILRIPLVSFCKIRWVSFPVFGKYAWFHSLSLANTLGFILRTQGIRVVSYSIFCEYTEFPSLYLFTANSFSFISRILKYAQFLSVDSANMLNFTLRIPHIRTASFSVLDNRDVPKSVRKYASFHVLCKYAQFHSPCSVNTLSFILHILKIRTDSFFSAEECTL